MSSRKTAGKKPTKKRAQRATSNVFAMFDQAQIQEFKEAFNMIDQNRDGFIDKEDLHDMLASLGKLVHVYSFLCCLGLNEGLLWIVVVKLTKWLLLWVKYHLLWLPLQSSTGRFANNLPWCSAGSSHFYACHCGIIEIFFWCNVK